MIAGVACRTVALLVALLGAEALFQAGARADVFPSKPIRLLVGSTPGGAPDLVARSVGAKFQSILGQPAVVENRPGAGGALAAEVLAKSPPDGYALALVLSTMLTSTPGLYRNPPFDPITSFVPVAGVAIQDFLLVVNPKLEAQTLREFIALAKARPGKINYASAGNGSPHHLGMEMFKRAAGINLLHVPYRGAPAAVPDLLSGQVSAMLISYVIAKPLLDAGRIRALGVTSATRFQQAPDIPTFIESGVPGFTHNTWFAFVAPAGTPGDVVAKLSAAVNAILSAEEVKARFVTLGLDPWHKKPDEILATLRTETESLTRLIREADIRID